MKQQKFRHRTLKMGEMYIQPPGFNPFNSDLSKYKDTGSSLNIIPYSDKKKYTPSGILRFLHYKTKQILCSIVVLAPLYNKERYSS